MDFATFVMLLNYLLDKLCVALNGFSIRRVGDIDGVIGALLVEKIRHRIHRPEASPKAVNEDDEVAFPWAHDGFVPGEARPDNSPRF